MSRAYRSPKPRPCSMQRRGWEDPRPSRVAANGRKPLPERAGQLDPAGDSRGVARVVNAIVLEMHGEMGFDGATQHRPAIVVALPSSIRDLFPTEVDLLHAQAAIEQA